MTSAAPATVPVAPAADQTQWVTLAVGRFKDQDTSHITIYMTGGSFVLSNTPSAEPIQVEVRDPVTGKRELRTEQRTFGSSSENPAGTAQIWVGDLIPGTYFVGVQGDLSTLSISGDAVTYTLPTPAAPATPVAAAIAPTPAPVGNPPAAVGNPPSVVAMPTDQTPVPIGAAADQTQWVSFAVARIHNQYDNYVTITMVGGNFVIANSPNPQPVTVEVRDPKTGELKKQTEPGTFGAGTDNADASAKTWAGRLVPGTYFVGVQGDLSALHISGEAVTYLPPAPAAPAGPVAAAPTPAPVGNSPAASGTRRPWSRCRPTRPRRRLHPRPIRRNG